MKAILRVLATAGSALALVGCAAAPEPYRPAPTYTDAAINAQLTRAFAGRIATLGLREIGAQATFEPESDSVFFGCRSYARHGDDNACYSTELVARYGQRERYVYGFNDFDGPYAELTPHAQAVEAAVDSNDLWNVRVTATAGGVQFHMPTAWRVGYSRSDALELATVAMDHLLRPLERERSWTAGAPGPAATP